jgi:hypothetical protein
MMQCFVFLLQDFAIFFKKNFKKKVRVKTHTFFDYK